MTTTRSPAAVYLAASSHEATLREMAALIATEAPSRRPLRVAATYACAGGAMAARVSDSIGHLFGGAEVRRFTVEGEASPMAPSEAGAIVAWADVVFVSGGDPVLGARRFARAGADAWLRDARAQGTPCLGISAGSILLGAWWAEWPDHPPPKAPHDGGELVRCAGVVPDVVVDCHAEADDWSELRLVRAMLHDRAASASLSGSGAPPAVRFFGLPTGGGIVVRGDGTTRAVGGPPVLF